MSILAPENIENNLEGYMKNLNRKVDNLIKGVKPLSDDKYDFEVVAVRVNSKFSTGKKKLSSNLIYYLLEGYHIEKDTFFVDQFRNNLNRLYSDFCCITQNSPHVQVSAIVGKNGCGKSSLIEFMIRLINNYAAAIFGEYRDQAQDTNLNFINDVDGDIWFANYNKSQSEIELFQLHVDNRSVYIKKLQNVNKAGKAHIIFERDLRNSREILIKKIEDNEEFAKALSSFFYTVVINYSIYAYNTNDFKNETNSFDKLEKLPNAQIYFPEVWLNGLFHRNDSYQIPLVLTPDRKDGNIDINLENDLAIERLTTLLIRNEGFRTINGHLVVDKFELYLPILPDVNEALEEYGFPNLSKEDYNKLKEETVKAWSKIIDEDLTKYYYRPYYDNALDYLTYKTLKIAYKYPQHRENLKELRYFKETSDVSFINNIVKAEAEDLSHVTRKIFRTIAYLIYEIYNFAGVESKLEYINIPIIEENWKSKAWPKFKKYDDFGENRIRIKIHSESLMPPPFMVCDILLMEKDSLFEKSIKFNDLSSGERQFTNAICSILYHLDNLNSTSDDYHCKNRMRYSNAFIILEEIELYFHPAFQQQLIKYILEGISQVQLDNISGIHLLLVTHSPYVLSDIPKENVLPLKDDGMPSSNKIKSFGANMHEMLKDSFFMPYGTIGDFAQWETGHILAVLDVHKKYLDFLKASEKTNGFSIEEINKIELWRQSLKIWAKGGNSVYGFLDRYISIVKRKPIFHYTEFNKDFPESYLKERIMIMDEPIVKNILERELLATFPKSNVELKQERIRRLEEELRKVREEE